MSTTGSTVRGRHVLRFLAERHDVHLVHMKEKHADGRDEALLGRLASYAVVPYSGLGYFLFSPELYRKARTVLERERIDFIFADFEKAGLYASRLARRFGKPFFYSSHNVEFRRYLDVGRKQPLRLAFVPYLYWAERTACRGALATFAISESGHRISFCPHTWCVHLPREGSIQGGCWADGIWRYKYWSLRNNYRFLRRHYGGLRARGAPGVAWANIVVYSIVVTGLVLFLRRNHPFPLDLRPITLEERTAIRELIRARS